MKIPARPTWLQILLGSRWFLLGILSATTSAYAQIDASINQTVWQNCYGVRNDQLYLNADPNQGLNTAWLNADDDSDGLSNGAELTAGTNPFSNGSMLKVKGVASDATTMTMTVPTVPLKLYITQSTNSLSPPNWQTIAVQTVGDGADRTLTATKSGVSTFFRVSVQDQSTASDQVSDWAKQAIGLNPGLSIGSQSGYSDHTAFAAALKGQSVVTITVPDGVTTMPPDGSTAPTDLGVITISRGGYLLLNSITVPLVIAGTAQPGVDYTSLPSSVTIPSGVKSVDLKVSPIYNPGRKTNTTVTVTLQPGGGYTVGAPSKASVTINPSQTALGTGLTGSYFVGGTTTWSNTLFSGTAALTRVDPTVDFPTTTWGNSLSSPITTTNYKYVVRWTGQVQPQYTETYYFDVRSADGVKLWVNGQLIIDKWQSQTVTDQIGSINLQAGVYYDIQLDYLHNGSSHSAEAHIYWYSNSQVKQVIPTNRLYPSTTGTLGAAPPAITSAPSAVAYVNQPFSFTITASNNPTAFALNSSSIALPAGLSLNTSTGVVSGTATTAGDYPLAVQATNNAGTGCAVLDIMVLNTGNAITREIWNGLAGGNISDLNAKINGTPSVAPQAPNSTDTLTTSLEDATTYADNTGERLRGYFTAPTTGNYYFWIAANNVAELWMSNNNEPSNKVRRAYVTAPGTASRVWDSQANQKSPWLSLVGGQKYYIEILHNNGTGGTKNVSVAWYLDPTGNTAIPVANGSSAASAPVGGVVPAYVLWPWDNPPTLASVGSIYSTNLQPLSGVNSTAVGSAFVRVNGSSGILHLNSFGLSSGVLSRRIYAMPVGNSLPQLLFDLDSQDKLYPNLRTSDSGYTWNLQSADLTALTNGTAYLSITTVNNPSGEISGLFGLTAGSQAAPSIPSYPTWTDDHNTDAGASRFLTQATFGPSPADMAYVKANGYRAWIENQFTLAATHHVPYVLTNANTDPTNLYPSTLTFNAWWQNSITAPDQLRQRLAFALSEIMVVSDSGVLNNNGRTLSDYYDTLLDYGFGYYKDLLKQVTLTSAMGLYLDMLANDLGDITVGRHPNENYAREIMQLFSIGLYRLWPDGTLVLDSNGGPVATYDQNVITGMARVFTGWTWGQSLQGTGRLPSSFYPSNNYLDPMVLVPTHHELGSKVLLDNAMLPPAVVTTSSSTATDPSSTYTIQTTSPTLGPGNLVTTTITNLYDLNGLRDFEASMASICNHSNVGPFICRQLIQRFVTSNPKPAYVNRVVRAFNGEQNVDGVATGVRGDMKEVIRAILLDYEARSTTASQDIGFGKQREPLLRVTGPARSFPSSGTTATGTSIFPLTAAYRESGAQAILVTSSVPHRLSSGDYVSLDFGTSANNLPTNQSYSVANATPSYSYDKTTGIATGNAPGYQAGDSVQMQFTSGNLNVSPYNSLTTYTVLASPPPTGTTFSVSVAAANTGPSTGSGTTLTPYNFTVNAGTGYPTSYSYTVSGTTATIAGSGYVVGNQAYLQFTSGGLLSAGYDSTYTILTSAASSFTIGLPSTPSSSVAGNCLIPKLSAGYVVTTSGSTSTIAISTTGNHNLSVGSSVYLHFLLTQTPNPALDGVYTIAPGGILDLNHFNITTSPALTSTSQGTSGLIAYPLVAPPLTRSGSVTIRQSTWQMNYTTGDSSTTSIGQTPLDAPTVFNYYYPDFKYPGEMAAAGMTTPEFQISGDTTTLSLTNYINQILSASNANGLLNFKSNPAPVVLDLGPYMTSGQTSDATIPALVDTLSALLTGGNLQPATRTIIINYVASQTNFPLSSPPTNSQMRDRVRAIVHLILVSAEYAIQK